ncbi:putative tail fiber protein [Aeromonas phage Gekk3-15]
MTQVNASGFGTTVTLTASNTFPQGFKITQFADDADSLDMPELTLAESGMGLNGTHVVWAKPGVMELVTNIIPNTPDDSNLAILAENNRVAEGKRVSRDNITFVISYPDGSTITLADGIIVGAMPIKSISQAGRIKTRPYKFRFTGKSSTGG